MAHHGVVTLLIRYSIPTTIGYAAYSIYNLVDRIFIGRVLGAHALAGISITFPVFMICIAIGMMIGIGGAAMTSLRLGENKNDEAERILGNVVAMFLLAALGLTLLGQLMLNPMLRLFGASAETLPYALTYMRILLFFLFADFIAMGMNGMLRAEGNPHISMTYLLLGACLNIGLDYLLIVQLDVGIAGAAIATGISKTVSSVAILLHFTRGSGRALTLRLHNLRLKLTTVISIFRIGLSPFTMQFVQSTVIILLNRVLFRHGGDVAVGAMGIIYAVYMLLMIPTMGLIHGAQPIMGYSYGARKYRRVKRTLIAALAYACSVSLVATLLVRQNAFFLVGLFARDDQALLLATAHGLRILLLLMPLATAQMVGGHYFQATGRPALSIALHLFRQLLCLITALMILPRIWGLDGVWFAIPTADFLAAALTTLFLGREMKALNRKQKKFTP